MSEVCTRPDEALEADVVGESFDDYLATVEAGLDENGRRLLAAFRGRYSLASQLLSLRKEAGLSQTQVAERAGVHQSTITRVERGYSNFSQGTLEKIGAVFNARLAFVPMTASMARSGFPKGTSSHRFAN
jgi:DNA-binding XRE family transcriptional regulator